MAKSTRSSKVASKPTSQPPAKPVNKRVSSQFRLGGTLATLLILLLYWWFTGSAPTGEITVPTLAVPPLKTVTVMSTLTAPPEPTTATQVVSSAVRGLPAKTLTPPATATAQPLSTATQRPNPTSSPTRQHSSGPVGMAVIMLDELPPEARETLALIEDGGPFPFSRDGITFQNRERLLPQKARDYYSEYTVITPGESDRGARRIIAGEAGELYYTADHYASFAWIEMP